MAKRRESFDNGFSEKTREIVGWSREIAIESGYDYISTVHFFLADCKSDYNHSIKNFALKDNSGFASFYQDKQIDSPSLLQESLPLTLEAEQTIRLAVQLWLRTYVDNEIEPYHLFLAAANLKNSLFYSSFQKQNGLLERLEKYYVNIGAIEEKNIHHSFLKKLFHR